MVHNRLIEEMDYEDTQAESKLFYRGSNFSIVADKENDLEVRIVTAFNEDPALQKALEFQEKNRLYHTEDFGVVGLHVEQILSYFNKIATRYALWQEYREIVRPVLIWHDICKIDEEYYGFNALGHPNKDHRALASELASTVLEIGDETFHKLTRHHDDHYKLYRERESRIINKLFKAMYQDFSEDEMIALILFGFADRHRKKPNNLKNMQRYNQLRRLFREQMNWFIGTTKQTGFIPETFKPFH